MMLSSTFVVLRISRCNGRPLIALAQCLHPPLHHDVNLLLAVSEHISSNGKQLPPGKVQGSLPAIAINLLKPAG